MIQPSEEILRQVRLLRLKVDELGPDLSLLVEILKGSCWPAMVAAMFGSFVAGLLGALFGCMIYFGGLR